MTENREAMDILMGAGSAPSVTFGEVPGREVGGRIVAGPTRYHAREYSAVAGVQGALKFYDDGNAIYGVTIDVQTLERDSADDDGVRRFYVEKRRMRRAIADAIRAAGSDYLEVDGSLYVTRIGQEPSQGGQPAKTYSARYISPGQTQVAGQTLPSGHGSQAFTPIPRDAFVAMQAAGLDTSNFTPVG